MDLSIAVAITLTNIGMALIIVSWCNKRIKEITDKDNWRK